MDLLSQYKQDHPEAFQKKKSMPLTDEYGRTYTGMIALVMRISGGRIRDARTASYALLAVAGIIVLASLVIFFGQGGGSMRMSPGQIEYPSGQPPRLKSVPGPTS